MRGLVVPDEEADTDALLRLVLEQRAQRHALRRHRIVVVVGCRRPHLLHLRRHLRRHRLPHEPHLGVHRPPRHVHQVLRPEHRQAHVLPAPPRLEHPAPPHAVQLAAGHVRVLVQLHLAPAPRREVGRRDAAVFRVVDALMLAGGDERGGDDDGGAGLRPPAAVGAVQGELPPDDGRGGRGEDVGGGEDGDADEVGAEGVGVLDVEGDAGGVVGEVEQDMGGPLWVLGVADDVGAGERVAGDDDGGVRVGRREEVVAVRLAAAVFVGGQSRGSGRGWAVSPAAGGRGRGGGGGWRGSPCWGGRAPRGW